MDKTNAKQAVDLIAAAGQDDAVKDVTLATFMTDVIDASQHKLVIVDFWAPWCGPCKQLGPVLEKAVKANRGTVALVKIDIDKNPKIAQQMRVQSIPAVFAFFQGRPVDGFMGALPESQIKKWIEKLLKAIGNALPQNAAAEIESALKQAADFLAQGDHATAQAIYADVLAEVPDNAPAMAGQMRCLLTLGEADKARQMLDRLRPEIAKDKVFEGVRTALEVAEQAQKATGSITGLSASVEKNPDDHQARFNLALAYYAAGRKEEAVDSLLEIVRRNRSWNDDAARKQIVKFFEAFGPADPLTVSARKRLSSILFS